jgi:hypothetical protein
MMMMRRRLFSSSAATTTSLPATLVRPRLHRQFAVRESIPVQLIPTFVNGRWRKPAYSLRKQADLRKQALLSDKLKEGATLEQGGWDPRWDANPIMQIPKPPKVDFV